MNENSRLLIRPLLTDAKELVQQQEDVRGIICPAIKYAGMESVDKEPHGTIAGQISPELVRQVYDAGIVVFDANAYGPWSDQDPFLAPALCYLLGVRHMLGNRILLVGSLELRLPPTLHRHHAVTYSRTRPVEFYDEFKQQAKAGPFMKKIQPGRG